MYNYVSALQICFKHIQLLYVHLDVNITRTTSDSFMWIDFAHCVIFLAHMTVRGTDRLIICHAMLIKIEAECWQLSPLHHTDQWP